MKGNKVRAEYTFARKDGSEFLGEVNSSVLRDTAGKVIGSISITEDITERRRMEEQLIITDRLASIGELASGVAHELNNPLTSVIGFSELLLGRKNIADDIREDLNMINREAQRTAGVVRNLLTFARKHSPEKQSVDINSVLKKVLELRAYEHRISNIQVNTKFATELPETMADSFQLQQVFLNIIINAEYFMIQARGRGALDITTELGGGMIRITITDDGPGISKENLKHLFTPFFTTKEVGKGTGLGLSICYGIITAHGGKIYAESEYGKGATFTVELPISKGNQ
jgi:two-component system NtrC family sensor kinase